MSNHETKVEREILVHRFAQPGEMVEWIEPWPPDVTVTLRMSYEDTAKSQHFRAKKDGHFYDNDQQAVEDFMVVHWAWAVIETKEPV